MHRLISVTLCTVHEASGDRFATRCLVGICCLPLSRFSLSTTPSVNCEDVLHAELVDMANNRPPDLILTT